MKFYDRYREIAELKRLNDLAEKSSQLTVLVGRRRIGKTTLLLRAYEGERDVVYFFVGKKSEKLLAEELQAAMKEKLGMDIRGKVGTIAELVEMAMQESQSRRVTLIIDEFQRLSETGEEIITEIQRVWDTNHATSHFHLIACGSIYSMMQHIFEDRKEPLFGRKTARINLRPFGTGVLKEILRDHNPGYTTDDLLMFYAITGGVAKYASQLMDNGSTTESKMIEAVCNGSSPFLQEGTELMVGEFGKKYQIYYSIMELIAKGMTTQAEIDGVIGKNTGRYLDTLESEYSLITRNRPMWSKPGCQGVRYEIDDNFLLFWFRYIESNRFLVEQEKYELLKEEIERGYPEWSGHILERYFRQKYGEKDRVTEVSHWWDSKGENEIDMIAIEKLDRRATIAEVKRNKKKYSETTLRAKVEKIEKNLRGYEVTLCGLSMEDM